jgi:murein L,D-transpeptidase YcbB/YkuD
MPEGYQKLQDVRSRLQHASLLAPIIATQTIRVGDACPQLPLIHDRLRQLGYAPPPIAESGTPPRLGELDRLMIEQFQRDRGLETDGMIGKQTLRALNRQPADIASTIAANLERLQSEAVNESSTQAPTQSPPALPSSPLVVEVNIPAYQLTLLAEDRPLLTMPVIVGKPKTPTAVFSAQITGVTFNPWWRVPTSIVREELIPQLRKNPYRVASHGMELLFRTGDSLVPQDILTTDWSTISPSFAPHIALRQRPGPHNPLGSLKFEMPNPHTIYLHDTSSPSLFEKTQRAFSHGCIRVREPIALAQAILGGKQRGWDTDDIRSAIALGKTRTISVRPAVAVRTVYRTAWVDEQGRLQLREDLYGLDRH